MDKFNFKVFIFNSDGVLLEEQAGLQNFGNTVKEHEIFRSHINAFKTLGEKCNYIIEYWHNKEYIETITDSSIKNPLKEISFYKQYFINNKTN